MKSLRILVVEDEDIIRMILAETLEDGGYTAVSASNGDEAIEVLDHSPKFDLVVTDVQMPGKADGLAVGRHVRELDKTTPVIYVTGRPESMKPVNTLGPRDALIRKPYGPRDIMPVIGRMLKASGGR